MHARTQRRQNFRHLHPAIFLEICGNNFIGVLLLPPAGSATAGGIFKTKSALGYSSFPPSAVTAAHPLFLRPAISLWPTRPRSRSPLASAKDHSKTFPRSNQRTTAAWIFPARAADRAGEWPGLFVPFKRHRGNAPVRWQPWQCCLRIGSTSQRSVHSSWELLAETIRAAPKEEMGARHPELGTHQAFSWREWACGLQNSRLEETRHCRRRPRIVDGIAGPGRGNA